MSDLLDLFARPIWHMRRHALEKEVKDAVLALLAHTEADGFSIVLGGIRVTVETIQEDGYRHDKKERVS